MTVPSGKWISTVLSGAARHARLASASVKLAGRFDMLDIHLIRILLPRFEFWSFADMET